MTISMSPTVHQDLEHLVPAIRAAVPKLSLRSHVLAEAAKLVEIQRPGPGVVFGGLKHRFGDHGMKGELNMNRAGNGR